MTNLYLKIYIYLMKSITVEKKHSKWFRSFFLESTNPDGTNRSEP